MSNVVAPVNIAEFIANCIGVAMFSTNGVQVLMSSVLRIQLPLFLSCVLKLTLLGYNSEFCTPFCRSYKYRLKVQQQNCKTRNSEVASTMKYCAPPAICKNFVSNLLLRHVSETGSSGSEPEVGYDFEYCI